MIITRKRLRERGYILVNTARAGSLSGLRQDLRDLRSQHATLAQVRLAEQDTGSPSQYDFDTLDAKYRRALRRIAELESR